MQCLKALNSKRKDRRVRGHPHTRPAHQLRRGVDSRLTKSRQGIKMLRDKMYKAEETREKAKRRKSGATQRKERAEEQCNQQRRPKQPQSTNENGKKCGRTVQPTKATETTKAQNTNERSVRKDSSTNKGDRNNHNAK